MHEYGAAPVVDGPNDIGGDRYELGEVIEPASVLQVGEEAEEGEEEKMGDKKKEKEEEEEATGMRGRNRTGRFIHVHSIVVNAQRGLSRNVH